MMQYQLKPHLHPPELIQKHLRQMKLHPCLKSELLVALHALDKLRELQLVLLLGQIVPPYDHLNEVA